MLARALPFYPFLVWRKKFKGLYASSGERHFLMPETFMNLSGESVFAAASFYKIKVEEILVAHDELELPLGTISLKFGGGLGGHNGLRSMKKCFDSADFWRIRIGLGRPDSRLPGEGGPEGSGEGIYDWVLSDFAEEEAALLAATLDAGASLLMKAMEAEPETLLPEWAKKKITLLEAR
jgi:PTH1 family peptidyl-tRNA hydrolase